MIDILLKYIIRYEFLNALDTQSDSYFKYALKICKTVIRK